MPNTPIMFMGCTSDAGKSFITAIACRLLARQGKRVAPFKAQNMSNNAAVTATGGEIGRAQYLQALAARQTPRVEFNPVLLKPQGNVLSQIILMGKADRQLSSLHWHARRDYLWPVVQNCLMQLQHEYEQLVIEGAGSPAEVNLRKSDIVNMEVALACNADVYLIADINRGGAYAHLYGTYLCLSPAEQQRVKGFILNQFRGDESLLKDANDWLLAKTGIPIVAVIPYLPHHLPEEDNFFHRGQAKHGQINIGLICYPYASNMDEFDPLAYCEGVSLIAVRETSQLENLDALILPGSKHVAASREFLATSQLDQAIQQFAKRGKPVLGICGGLQLLGEDIHDAEQIEGGSFSGLGLLPLHTQFHKQKTTVQRTVHWQGSDLQVYEIHQGQSHTRTPLDTFVEPGSGWQRHNISASYLHGLFENQVFLQHYLNQLGWQGKIQGNWQQHIEQELERVSDLLAERFGFL